MRTVPVIICICVAVVTLVLCSAFRESRAGDEENVRGRFDWEVRGEDTFFVFDTENGDLWIITGSSGKWVREKVTGKRIIDK